jgi:hypothetical protein
MIRATLTQAAHFVLFKNYLAATRAPHVIQVLRDLVGLPAEPADLPFLAAYARVTNFDPNHLITELYQHRTCLKSALMRSASYIVLTESYPIWYAATVRQRNQDSHSEFRLWGVDPPEVEQLEQAISAVLTDQPATAAAIIARLPQHLVRELTQTSRGGRVTTTSSVALALRWLVAKGVLGAVPVSIQKLSGLLDLTALSDSIVYAPLAHWYPNLHLFAAPGEAAAQAELVWAYLAAFGPASEADISFWTGFGKSETARAIGALAAKTTLTLVEGMPGMLLLLKEQAEALQSTPAPAEPMINILPADDPYLTAHRASRSRYFNDQKLQRLVFGSTGAAQPAIVVNGQIVGTWERSDQQLTWRLLTVVDSALLPLIQAKVEQVGAFIQPNLTIRQEENLSGA